MSATADSVENLQPELQNVLNTTNEVLLLISEELQKINSFTSEDGEFAATIKQSASLLETLLSQKLGIANLPPVAGRQLDSNR